MVRVTLPAADREARSALAARGLALETIGPDTVTVLMAQAGLAQLRSAGLTPIDVTLLDFPPADSAYHNYAELLAEIQAVAQAHPDIMQVRMVGRSVEGREIIAVKISDNPMVDEPGEPAVLFMALTHAEHLTVEMALATIRLFAEQYGRDPAFTNLVEQRELYILPNVNPDGGEFDLATGYYQYWRKNRQPHADGAIGVDLNRNYGYRWGCCGGSSPIPSADTYRGPAPFSEPETQTVRDFVLAHPNITAAISFHTFWDSSFILTAIPMPTCRPIWTPPTCRPWQHWRSRWLPPTAIPLSRQVICTSRPATRAIGSTGHCAPSASPLRCTPRRFHQASTLARR